MIVQVIDGTPLENLTKGSHKKIIFECDTCEQVFEQSYRNYVKQKDGKFCRSCRNSHTGNRSDVSLRKSNYTKTRWQDPEYRKEMVEDGKLSKAIKKSWDSGRKRKYKEKDETIKNLGEIKKFLDDNNIDYKRGDRSFCLYYDDPKKRSYEIEYIPSIEYPIAYPKLGIDGVTKDYFYQKSLEAEENNSFKLWIKDFEWNCDKKREVLKSYILHATEKTQNKFYARECEVKVVFSKDARKFEVENCFYGKRGASLNLGLYSKRERNGVPSGTLLMLYTFGKNFFGRKDNIVEVIRVGTLKYSYVAGGSSKLLKYFINNYKTMTIGKNEIEVEQLKFYSDYDHNIGGSMDILGFDFVGYSGGGFMNYWTETKEIKNRQPMKHKWVMEQMSLGKVYAIPNAGVKTYVHNMN